MRRFIFFCIISLFTAFNAASQSKQFLYIEITPSDALLSINGQQKQTVNGIYEELLPLGTYEYRVHKDGYRTQIGTVTVDDPHRTKSLKIDLKQTIGYLSINGLNDSDFEIYIDSKIIGKSPLKHTQLTSGDHKLTIKHPLFKTYEAIVHISDEGTTIVSPDLVPCNVNTSIKTSPNADIYINGISKGKGTWSGILGLNKTYKLESSKAGHKTQKVLHTISMADHNKVINIPAPTPIYGSLDVNSSHEATLYIDGKQVGKTPMIIPDVIIGEHSVYLKSCNHKTEIQKTTVKKGKKSSLYFNIPQGSLSIQSTPTKAAVYLDGHNIGWTPIYLPEIVVDEHTVTVEFDECYATGEKIKQTKHININAGKESSVSFSAQECTGTLAVTAPKQAKVYMDNKLAGDAPGSFRLPVGEHSVTVEFDECYATGEKIKQTKRITIQEGKESSATFSIQECTGTLAVTVPKQTNLYVDNKLAGHASGSFLLPVGEHEIHIAAKHAKSELTRINITAGSEQVLSYSSLIVRTKETGVAVKLNDKTFSANEKIIIPSGKYQVNISLEDHKAYTATLNLTDAEEKIIDISAISLRSDLKCKFYIDNSVVVESPARVLLPIGRCTITATCDGYIDKKKSVTIGNTSRLFVWFALDKIEEIYYDEDYENFTSDEIYEITEDVVDEEPLGFQFVEEKPSFQGGDANQFSKWVNQRLVYPEIAKENGVQGRVTLQFTIEKDGSISKVKVLRGVDPSLDKEAVRVVSMSPKWTPGKHKDRAVPVTYTFPVIFQLR